MFAQANKALIHRHNRFIPQLAASSTKLIPKALGRSKMSGDSIVEVRRIDQHRPVSHQPQATGARNMTRST
jgi:hypothetical protein